MVTIEFKLNEENIKKDGKTINEIEKFLREFYKEKNVPEVDYLVFERDDQHALAEIGLIIRFFIRNPEYRNYFSECKWYINGLEENILEGFNRLEKKYGTKLQRRAVV